MKLKIYFLENEGSAYLDFISRKAGLGVMLQELEEILFNVLKHQGELHQPSVIFIVIHEQVDQPDNEFSLRD